MNKLNVVALTFTNQCNLKCVHCGSRQVLKDGKDEMSASFFLEILVQAKKLGAKQVNITGGEVFYRCDCFELIEGAVKLGLFVSIESNGTLLNEDDLNRLSRHSQTIRISFSLDGFSAQTHDAIRGDGNFNKTMAAVKFASQIGLSARIITVLHRGNIAEIPLMVRYCVEELGLGYRLLPQMLEYGRGVYACSNFGATYEDMGKLLEEFYYPYLRQNQSDKLCIELNPALVPIDIENHHVCPWGKWMIGVSPQGKVGLCHVSSNDPNFIFGDLKTQSLREIWRKSPELQKFRDLNPNNLHGICGNCLAREVCRGGCRLHALTKYKDDFYAPDPQCQAVYNQGKFPDYAIEKDTVSCDYPHEGR